MTMEPISILKPILIGKHCIDVTLKTSQYIALIFDNTWYFANNKVIDEN